MLKLRDDSLDWALAHILLKGDTDIFPKAFEFNAISHNWDEIRNYLRNEDILTWTSKPLRRCLSPKRRYGFRVATQLDPLDSLIFAALVYEVGADIETRRLSSSEDDDQSVLSCRFAPKSSGEIFDSSVGFRSFQNRAIKIAERGEYSYVVSTDIADFFPRLYHHRVEGALSSATNRQNHVIALSSLLSQWNQTQSYGIPVGPAPARLIAEIAIDDVDKILRSEGIAFARYMDDYRLFAESPTQAYKYLVTLANTLYKNHGLTLQQEKTSILPAEKFIEQFGETTESQEVASLSESFHQFLAAAGINDPYREIDYENLCAEQRQQIDAMNLEVLLKDHLAQPELDYSMVRFLLGRLGQLDNTSCVDSILTNLDNTFTVFPQVIQYFGRLKSLTNNQQHSIGQHALDILDDSPIFQLDFHRTWLFSLFSEGAEWGHSESLVSLYTRFQDNFSRRKLALAIGESDQHYWFRTNKDDVFEMGGWLRRAFLAGSSCLPNDERKHWFNFLKPRLDLLEKSVIDWARSKSH